MNKFIQGSMLTLSLSVLLGLVYPSTLLAAGPSAINLGSAGNFVILSKTGISTTGATSVVGDMGLSPAAATYITGFALALPSASAFATSALVTGKVYAPGYADPTPSNITTAVSDMQTAYTDGAGRTNPSATELGSGNIGGLTIAPGLYKWGTGVTIPSDVTLAGSANDVWIFQIAQTLNVSSGVKVVLSGGAQASNVFWIVAGQTTIGTTAVFNGNILDQTAIVLNTGATLHGRALAQTAVTLDANAVTAPSASVTVTPTPTPTPSVSNSVTSTSAPTTTSTPSVTSTSNSTGGSSYSASPSPSTTSTTMTTNANNSTTLVRAPEYGALARAIRMNLAMTDRSDEVRVLQEFLIAQKGVATEALANVGATGYFGALTRAALAEFQANVGITPALGNFGPITRAYLSAHY